MGVVKLLARLDAEDQRFDLESRRVICHWHLQLSDPLYRAFTGEHLLARSV